MQLLPGPTMSRQFPQRVGFHLRFFIDVLFLLSLRLFSHPILVAVLTEPPTLPLPGSELAQNFLARMAAREWNRKVDGHPATGGTSQEFLRIFHCQTSSSATGVPASLVLVVEVHQVLDNLSRLHGDPQPLREVDAKRLEPPAGFHIGHRVLCGAAISFHIGSVYLFSEPAPSAASSTLRTEPRNAGRGARNGSGFEGVQPSRTSGIRRRRPRISPCGFLRRGSGNGSVLASYA